MQHKNKLPQLAISITDECNYKCFYCRPSGSSVSKCSATLPFKEIVRLLSIAYNKGFRVFRITGGEPFLRTDIIDIIKAINNFGDDNTILIGTNGILLGKYIDELKKYDNVKFFISLDSINKEYKGLPKNLTKELFDNLTKLSKTNFVRINMLVLESNKDEVEKVINFCQSLKIDLKLHDLYYCEAILDPIKKPEKYFDLEYYDIKQLSPYLKKQAEKVSRYPENAMECGIPMESFSIGNINIIIKDSLKGSYYNSSCQLCNMYPCLHGLYCPIIASDGTIQPSNCVNKKFHRLIANQSTEDIEKAFDFVLSIINESKFETIQESVLNVKKEIQQIDLTTKAMSRVG